MPTKKNENCLAGMKCPDCGSLEPFDIQVTMIVKVEDEGTEECGDTDWSDDSHCRCRECDYTGTVADFMYVDIVFDGPPGPTAGRFVEVEDSSGASIKLGEWIKRDDDFWVLRIPDPRRGR